MCVENYTLVTSFVDIGRGNWSYFSRSNDAYLNYSVRLLQLNVPLILFIEHKFVDFVKLYREGKENVTKIITITVQDLEYYKLHQDVSEAQKIVQQSVRLMNNKDVSFDTHPEVFSPEYVIVMASKVSLVKEAIRLNPFHSSFFYWIDFGFGRSDDYFPSDSCWAPRNIMKSPKSKDKVVIMELSPIYFPWSSFNLKAIWHYLTRPKVRTVDDFIRHMDSVFVMGTFFGGAKEAMLEFDALYKQVFNDALARGYTDDDQTIITLCYISRNDLFYSVYSFNSWFQMLLLFH